MPQPYRRKSRHRDEDSQNCLGQITWITHASLSPKKYPIDAIVITHAKAPKKLETRNLVQGMAQNAGHWTSNDAKASNDSEDSRCTMFRNRISSFC